MTCMFRAVGIFFDVDAFLQQTRFKPQAVWRKGERRGQSSSSLNTYSGFFICASEAGFTDIRQQIEDAILFLRHHVSDLEILTQRTDIEDITLDFGIEDRPAGPQADSFPPDLLELMARFNISLTISRYPVGDDDIEA